MGNFSHRVGDYDGSPGSEYDFPRYYEKDYTRLMEIKKRSDRIREAKEA